jgi:hypothetical protein
LFKLLRRHVPGEKRDAVFDAVLMRRERVNPAKLKRRAPLQFCRRRPVVNLGPDRGSLQN